MIGPELDVVRCPLCEADVRIDPITGSAVCEYCRTVVIPEKTAETTKEERLPMVCSETKHANRGDFVIKAGTLLGYHGSMAEITIPEGVTKIGDAAFKDTGITSVTLPSSLRKIGSSAFSGTFISGILELPESLTEIDDLAFCETKLETVIFNPRLRRIGKYAFADCKGITAVDLSSLKGCKIESGAFLKTSVNEVIFGSKILLTKVGAWSSEETSITLKREGGQNNDGTCISMKENDAFMGTPCNVRLKYWLISLTDGSHEPGTVANVLPNSVPLPQSYGQRRSRSV